MADKLWIADTPDGAERQMCFHCPGCGYGHSYRVKGEEPAWQWNGSMELPTFTPSLLVWGNRPEQRCHLFVRDGKIEFLDDCFHELKGQTVEMDDVED